MRRNGYGYNAKQIKTKAINAVALSIKKEKETRFYYLLASVDAYYIDTSVGWYTGSWAVTAIPYFNTYDRSLLNRSRSLRRKCYPQSTI